MTESVPGPNADLVARARDALGPIGLHLPTVGAMHGFPMTLQVEAVQRLERTGYRATWNGEGVGSKDGLVELAVLLGATTNMVFGTAIANIWARPAETAHGASTVLADAFPDRFVFGLGAGYPFQAQVLGQRYRHPLSLVRNYLERMTAEQDMVHVPTRAYARILAANGPKMLGLAGEIADGAQPVAVPTEYTAQARAVLGTDKLLVVGLPVVVDEDRPTARLTARKVVADTVARAGSPYGANLVRLGYTQEEILGSSDRVIDAIVGYGGRDEIAAKAQEHLDAGADHVIVTPMVRDYRVGVEQLEWLAPAMTRC